MKRVYDDFSSVLTMGVQILESNSSGNLTRAVSEAGTVLPGYLAVILSVLMVTLVVVVVAGNALVIMAFVVDKTLRNQSNYFFLNLAISDFLVGELVPFLHHLLSQFTQIWLLFLSVNGSYPCSSQTHCNFPQCNSTDSLLLTGEFIGTSPSFLLHSFFTSPGVFDIFGTQISFLFDTHPHCAALICSRRHTFSSMKQCTQLWLPISLSLNLCRDLHWWHACRFNQQFLRHN